MRTEWRISLLVALALTLAPPVLAGRAEPAAQDAVAPHHLMHWLHATRHEVTGKIESLTASRLILASQTKGKEQEMTFALDPETQREGSVAAGTQATVRFRVENNQKIATFVTAHDATSSAAKSEGPKR
jgi:hypothetical protein